MYIVYNILYSDMHFMVLLILYIFNHSLIIRAFIGSKFQFVLIIDVPLNLQKQGRDVSSFAECMSRYNIV